MNSSKIEYCTKMWNPVTGCLNSCPYCYARGIAKRFSGCSIGYGLEAVAKFKKEWESGGCKYMTLDEPLKRITKSGKLVDAPYPWGFEPTFHRYRLDEPQKIKKPQTIFVGSMCDLFGDWIPDEWIAEVFDATNKAPQHIYVYLTKNPDRYYQLSDDVEDGDGNIVGKNLFGMNGSSVSGWFGATATTVKQAINAYQNMNCTWLSIEPIQEDFQEFCDYFMHYDHIYTNAQLVRWKGIVIGCETGNRKDKVIPKREWIETIVDACRESNTPVFLKDNLIPILGKEYVRANQQLSWEV